MSAGRKIIADKCKELGIEFTSKERVSSLEKKLKELDADVVETLLKRPGDKNNDEYINSLRELLPEIIKTVKEQLAGDAVEANHSKSKGVKVKKSTQSQRQQGI